MRSRCPSAEAVTTASLEGWTPVYDKPSRDGSAKLNITESPDAVVLGVVYEIDDGERDSLAAAEHLYDAFDVTVFTESGEPLDVLTYRWAGSPSSALPYLWYVEMAQAGAAHHGIPEAYYSNHLSADAVEDPAKRS